MNPSRHLAVVVILHSICLLYQAPSTHAYKTKQVSFYMQKDRGLPQGHTPILTLQTPTSIECARACRNNDYCYTFHAEKHAPDDTWTCHILDQRFRKTDIPVGTGIFGTFFGYRTNYKNHATIPGAEYLFKTNVWNDDYTAIYDCRKTNYAMGTVGIVYDYYYGYWPAPSPKCAETLCNEMGLSATALKIDQDIENDITQNVEIVCPRNDVYFSDATCDIRTGEWSYDYEPLVGCISETCVRYNSKGKAVYAGGVNETTSGKACLPWEDIDENLRGDFFPEDYNQVDRVSNMCRDPTGAGHLWCFHTSDLSEECDAPLCLWPFHI